MQVTGVRSYGLPTSVQQARGVRVLNQLFPTLEMHLIGNRIVPMHIDTTLTTAIDARLRFMVALS